MIIRLSEKLAYLTKEYNPDMPRSIGALTSQYAVFINTAAVVLLTLLIGYFNGKLAETSTVMIAFMFLRMVSGGYHLESLDACVVVTVLIFAGIPYIPILDAKIYTILNVVSVIIALARSPTTLPERIVNKRRYRAWLKTASVVIVAMGFVVNSPVITLSLFVQAITLIYTREEVNHQ